MKSGREMFGYEENPRMTLKGVRSISIVYASRVLLVCATVATVATSMLFPNKLSAAELGDSWFSVRAMGMGNAYTAVVEDSDALFYNPAGLAKISGFHWTIFDLHLGANGVEGLQAAQSVSGSNDMATALSNLYGKKVWVGGGGKSVLTGPGFGVGLFASTQAGLALHNPSYPVMDANYFFDYGAALGVAFDLVPSIMKVGVVGRRIDRTGTTVPVGPSVLATLDTSTLQSEFKSRGTAYGVDLGMILTVPGPIKPSLSFVWRNAGTLVFSHTEGAHAPPSVHDEMIVGGALKLDVPLITITPSIDYRYLTQTNVQNGNKLHLGVEIDLPLIDLRAGLNQGYYTAGLGLGLGPLQLDFATYGVELGEYPGQQEDRRYVAQITVQIGIDPGQFGFGGSKGSGGNGSGGERRKLKQRR
jgi:hypothetical protein